jgi:hypothetical protein
MARNTRESVKTLARPFGILVSQLDAKEGWDKIGGQTKPSHQRL